jgi:hypothetical protein
MNTIPRVRVAILVLLGGLACAHHAAAQSARLVATVTDVKGDCYVRDNAQAQPRKAGINDRLRASDEVLCNYESSVTIRYDATPGDRTVGPRWTGVGNAATQKWPFDEQRGGREAWMPPNKASPLTGG